MGELFQENELTGETGGKTVLMPSYHFEDDGRHTGWELHVETAGFITLQVDEPF